MVAMDCFPTHFLTLLLHLLLFSSHAVAFMSFRFHYFTEKEVNMMMKAGASAVGLGPHRLRVETATMALLATLMLWSDSQ
ncbi:hypothetical protein NC651_002949 [Populus alba x Populus x berolinensis]|nr:hypothetical protein NC651_002949 [Populus alba x Populus x berolinensis]